MSQTRPHIRILVADDHSLVLGALVQLLSTVKNFEVVGEASTGKEVLRLAREKKPDVVLMDLDMPGVNGLEATRILKREDRSIGILILTGYTDEALFPKIVEAGADGYITKTERFDHLTRAIETVASGQKHFPPSFPRSPTRERESNLSEREREILRLIALGDTHRQIAEKLCISVRTVDTHRNNIMRKLNRHDTASLVLYAIKEGLVLVQSKKTV